MLTFHAVGNWRPEQVEVEQVPPARPIVPEVESRIEAAWNVALQRPGVLIFDGPMSRLESWAASPQKLQLKLSTTRYKTFVGTNLSNPDLARRYGREILANPVGVSPSLQSTDGYLLLGKRNASVAYYPGRTHPFAGALEPQDSADPFTAVRRELQEELSLKDGDVDEIRCTGIVEDESIVQPEMIFHVRSTLTRSQIEAQVDTAEHVDAVAIPAQARDVEAAIEDPTLTPVAVASLLLWGRLAFGQEWFAAAERQVNRSRPAQ